MTEDGATAAGCPSVRSVGLAVPEHTFSQEELCEFMSRLHGLEGKATRRLSTLYRRSRIRTRHACLGDLQRPEGPFQFQLSDPSAARTPSTSERMALYRREAPPLAARACREAFELTTDVTPNDVDHLFVVTCTGFFAPSLDVILADELGLRADVGRTLIGFQGCQGGLTALRLAEYVCRARPDACALIACVELCTLHFQREPTNDNLLANCLFSDGAAAVLVAGAQVRRRGPALEIQRTETLLHPDSREEMTWSVGDTGFELSLGQHIPRLLGRGLRPLVSEKLGFDSPADLASAFWGVHPGGAAILDSLERSLELPSDRLRHSRDVLARHGNMSSPTVHFVLRAILDDPSVTGDGVALTFGPGLTVEAARLRKLPT